MPGEFPRFDERYAGLPYRYGWFAYRDLAGDSPSYNGLAGMDLKTGKRQSYAMADGDAVAEPIFVPRSADAEEGDGWLLTVAYRGNEQRSDLLIFEAQALPDGPIAEARLSSRVPFGFHGNWRPD